jgi:hypothetical protein
MPGCGALHWCNIRCAGCGNSNLLELARGQAARLRCSRCGRKRPSVKWIAGERRQRKVQPAGRSAARAAARQILGGVDLVLDDPVDDLFRGSGPRVSVGIAAAVGIGSAAGVGQ